MSRLNDLRYLSVLTELGVPFVTLSLADFNALLAVAEAAHELSWRTIKSPDPDWCSDYDRLHRALAPLLKGGRQ